MNQDNEEAFAKLIRKLEKLGTLSDEDKEAVRGLPFRTVAAEAGDDLVREGDAVAECCLLLEGYACRYKLTTLGARQILCFHFAGDILDLQHLLFSTADHGVQTLTDTKIARVPIAAIKGLIAARPAIAEALWRDTLIDASVFREWVLNVGQRDANARVAHMLCEFAMRREAAGLGEPEAVDLPMSQIDIADATGLSPVHVNRTLMALEADGIIKRDNRKIRISDWDRVREAADFDASYLHMAA